jgi:hypothetical protein
MRRPPLRFKVRSMIVAVAIAGVVVAFTKYLCIDNRPADRERGKGDPETRVSKGPDDVSAFASRSGA